MPLFQDKFGDATDISDDGKFLMVGATNGPSGSRAHLSTLLRLLDLYS